MYDPWSISVTEDVELYVAEAVASGGPGGGAGSGNRPHRRPVAKAGVRLIGDQALRKEQHQPTST